MSPEIPAVNDQSDAHNMRAIWKNFVINISVVILVFILAIFLGVQLNNEKLIMNELFTRAKSDFDNIVLTRRWAAQHGGVYVFKGPGVISNPYLVNPDMTATDGKIYTKKNPSLMTREISELSKLVSGPTFHITSLKPLNPNNKADAFEEDALHAFEAGTPEVFTIEKSGGRSVYRYMAPLFIEPACMACHAMQGYKIGDVRGGISVIFEITDVEERLKWNRYVIWGLSLAISIVLIAIIYSFIRKVKRLLDAAHAKISEMANTDELTRLHNRRYFMQRFELEFNRAKRYGHPLACVMLDIDFFKRVNDVYGHQAGDIVLKSMASIMNAIVRNTDVLARYGGEEFIMLLPETSPEGTQVLTEKLRAMIEQTPFTLQDGKVLQVTISIGVAHFSANQLKTMEDPHHLIKLADEALYRAKESGRNRVVIHQQSDAM